VRVRENWKTRKEVTIKGLMASCKKLECTVQNDYGIQEFFPGRLHILVNRYHTIPRTIEKICLKNTRLTGPYEQLYTCNNVVIFLLSQSKGWIRYPAISCIQ
jgi:hypothetical protein